MPGIMDSLVIYKDKTDITDDIKRGKGKGNPFGWSQVEILHNGKAIGFVENGKPDLHEGYSYEIMPYDEYKKLRAMTDLL